MEISNIAGPDIISSQFAVQKPHAENVTNYEQSADNKKEHVSVENKGEQIDTYA